MTPLTRQQLTHHATDLFESNPDALASDVYATLCRDHEVAITESAFVNGGYATAARRAAKNRLKLHEPRRPTTLPQDVPGTALTRDELAREREAHRKRRAARDAKNEARAERIRSTYQRPKGRKGRHPFARDFIVGKKRRKNPGELGDVEYLPPVEFVDTGVRRR